jgi:hypothetical protein
MRYRSLRVSSLGRWSPQLHAGFLVSGVTQERCVGHCRCFLPGCHGLRRRFPGVFGYPRAHYWRSAERRASSCNPVAARPAGLTRLRFRPPPVRSPLLRGYSLFLGVREMFQFPRCPPPNRGNDQLVVGLPHSEIVGSTPARGSPTLIAAMPRPSSARSAEASTLCSLCLP